jgi:hypothetical protein
MSQWCRWFSNGVNGSYGVELWKFIRKGWEDFSSFTIFEVGDSSKVNLWHDVWCGVLPLKGAFPEMFSIACLRDASMVDHF